MEPKPDQHRSKKGSENRRQPKSVFEAILLRFCLRFGRQKRSKIEQNLSKIEAARGRCSGVLSKKLGWSFWGRAGGKRRPRRGLLERLKTAKNMQNFGQEPRARRQELGKSWARVGTGIWHAIPAKAGAADTPEAHPTSPTQHRTHDRTGERAEKPKAP